MLAFLLPAAVFLELLGAQPRFAAWFHEGLSAKRQLLAEKSTPSEANRLMLTRVRDAQRAEAVAVAPDLAIGDAVALMRRHGVECLVVEPAPGEDGPGIVTRTDLLDALALDGHGLASPVGPLAHRPLIGVREDDVLMRRLRGTLRAAAERAPIDFPELLLTPGVGARTVEALAHVAEIVHGAPCRFSDPARFSLALGGKDGHPFPVPLHVYDRTLTLLRRAVDAAKLGNADRLSALRELDRQARECERYATTPAFDELVARERAASPALGGRSV